MAAGTGIYITWVTGAIVLSIAMMPLFKPSYARLSADGFIDMSLVDGETVVITQAGDYASFLRRKPAPEFWGDLSRRLGLRKGPLKSPPRELL